MTKSWTMIGISALLALTACTAAGPDDEKTESSEVKVTADTTKSDLEMRMKADCMVNDDGMEAICCSQSDCWYVDLYDPYFDR